MPIYKNFTTIPQLFFQITREFGAGMEWRMNIKPLDWFGWQMVGLKLGIITSEHVDGYFLGLTAR
jgi:hypothetical protein